jgi:hypothetical protein
MWSLHPDLSSLHQSVVEQNGKTLVSAKDEEGDHILQLFDTKFVSLLRTPEKVEDKEERMRLLLLSWSSLNILGG